MAWLQIRLILTPHYPKPYEPERGTFLSRDAWEGDALRPQTFNPVGLLGGNPINLADPSGNCYGPLEWLRSLPIEARNCIALDQSLYILGSGNYSDGDKRWAGAYVGTWTVGHSYLFVGAGIYGVEKLPAAVSAGRSALSAGSGLISAVTRWGQSYLLRHPNVGNTIGAGMVVASTVDDVATVHAIATGNPAAAGELITAASVDGQLPFADIIAGAKYFGRTISNFTQGCIATAKGNKQTLILFHGSTRPRSMFDSGIDVNRGQGQLGPGFYLAPEREIGEWYAGKIPGAIVENSLLVKLHITKQQWSEMKAHVLTVDEWEFFKTKVWNEPIPPELQYLLTDFDVLIAPLNFPPGATIQLKFNSRVEEILSRLYYEIEHFK